MFWKVDWKIIKKTIQGWIKEIAGQNLLP
jgi:hypothetical protein